MLSGSVVLCSSARRSKRCVHCVLAGFAIYHPGLGCCILFSLPNVISYLTISVNLLLGLSLGLLPDTYNRNTSHHMPFFLAFAFLQLAMHFPVLLSTVFSRLSVPHLLRQPISLNTPVHPHTTKSAYLLSFQKTHLLHSPVTWKHLLTLHHSKLILTTP